ncbi:MAG: hypothetical protein RL513_500 [Pseudomonadota bacterium]|jgi:hypothetical protein
MSTPSTRWHEVPANATLAFHGVTRRKWNLITDLGHTEAQVFESFDGAVTYQTDCDWSAQKWARTVRDAMVAAQNSTAAVAARRPPPDALGTHP